jgi:hypothetical protein
MALDITSIEELEDLTDDELWEVAADVRIAADIRHEAIRLWLFPDSIDPVDDPDDLGGGRMRELIARATPIDNDEIEEDDIEDFDRYGPYFDGTGRLVIEYDGVQYLIDSLDDEGAYDGVDDDESAPV